MNHVCTALVASGLVLGAAALITTEASARVVTEPGSGYTTTPDCHWAYHPVCHEVSVPSVEAAPSDDNGADTDAYEWPDEGSGYPGFAATSPDYTHPNYDPKYETSKEACGVAGDR